MAYGPHKETKKQMETKQNKTPSQDALNKVKL